MALLESQRQLVEDYLAGARLLRYATEELSSAQLLKPAPPGKWSILQVVCHLSDFELVYADRIKRALAENNPTIMSGDPDGFAANLAYQERNLEEELSIISGIRSQVGRILKLKTPDDMQRTATHSADGSLTVETLLRRVTGHIPHHIRFIMEKRQGL